MTTKVPPEMLEESQDLIGLVPVGGVFDYYGTDEPANFKYPRGQALNRTTYATLFALLGTTFGAGDGSTTFNLPDERGRVVIGKDNMGGTPANRVTSAVSGVDAATLGAVGGSQSLQDHNHTATVTDPGHYHSVSSRQANSPYANVAAGSGSVLGSQSTSTTTTGITVGIANTGDGASQNVQPSIVANRLMRVL